MGASVTGLGAAVSTRDRQGWLALAGRFFIIGGAVGARRNREVLRAAKVVGALVLALGCGRSGLKVLVTQAAGDGGMLLGSGMRLGGPDGGGPGMTDGGPEDAAGGAAGRDGAVDAAGIADGAGPGADAAPGAALVGLEIVPPFVSVGAGGTAELMAFGRYADGTRRDVSTLVTWSAAPADVVALTGRVARGLKPGEALVTAVLMGQRAVARIVVTAAKLVAVDVEPSEAKLAATFRLPLRAFALYADGGRAEVTAQATWASSDSAVATIASGAAGAGVVTGVKPGNATVSATFMTLVGRAAIEVTQAPLQAIEVTPALPKIPARSTLAFRATGIFADGTTADLTAQATWSSDTPPVLAFAAAPGALPGVAMALTMGTALVTARVGAISGSTVVVVTAPQVSALTVSPDSATVAKGGTRAFTARGTLADGSTIDLTRSVVWSTSEPATAAVSNAAGNEGVATGLSAGMTRVIATLGGMSASATLVVSAATVTSLAVTPATASVPVGAVIAFRATATFSDGSESDVSDLAAWTVADPAIASVSNLPGAAGTVRGLKAGMTEVRAAFGGQSASATVTVTGATLASLALEPASATIQAGRQQSFRATAVYDDGTRLDVTAQAAWLIDDTRVASVSNVVASRGLVTASSAGKTTLRARFEGKEGTAEVTVVDEDLTGIRITPQNPTLHLGETVAFVASGVYANGTTRPLPSGVTWTTSNATVAPLMGATARCAAAGAAMVTATYMGRTDTTTITCADPMVTDLQVLPFTTSVLVGQTQAFQAVAVFADASTRDVTNLADWSTSNAMVAVVTNTGARGRATGLAAGIVRVSASYRGSSASALLTVSDARLVGLSVSPVLAKVRVMQSVQFVASGLYSDSVVRPVTGLATWTSSNDAVADVNNAGARGRATGFAPGAVTITASYMGFSDTASLTVVAGKVVELQVTPVNATLVVGQRLQYQAVAIWDDGANQNVTGTTTWQSSDDKVADVSNGAGRGQATALAPGATTVTGTYMGVSASTSLTVTSARLTEIQVTPATASVPKGMRQQYQAVGIYSDNTSRTLTGQVTWTSSNRNVAAVSNAAGSAGQATALAAGTTQIVATFGGLSGRATLTVTDATLTEIQVTPAGLRLPKGLEQQYQAVGIYSDGSSRTLTGLVTWNSSDESIAAVSNAANKGTATAVSPGSVQVSASFEGKMGATSLTVTDATLKEVQVTPVNARLPRGISQQFHAVGLFSDGSIRTITSIATWNSSNEAIAAVTNTGGRGVVTAVAPGAAELTASLFGVTGRTNVTVTDASLTEIQVSPATALLPKGLAQPFVAIAVYSDLSTRNVTALATWASSDPAVATVSNAPGSHGRALAVGEGTARISAAFGGKTGAATLKVTAAAVARVEIVPVRIRAPVGVQVQLVATAVLSDMTALTVTDVATWTISSSSTAPVASVSNAPGSWGLLSTLASGSATVTASVLGVSGSAEVTVSSARLVSLAVRPDMTSVAVNGRAQLTATGTYDDGSTFDLTQVATWSSTSPSVAVVSNVDGGRGQVTGLAAGNTTIEAHVQTTTGGARVTVF